MTAENLAALLERLRLQPAGARTPSDVSQVQLDFLLARIGSLTDALRGSGWDEASRVASRLLLSDLALVAAQFRGDANAISESLSKASEGLSAALGQYDAAATGD